MKPIHVFLIDDSDINNLYMEDMLSDIEQIISVTTYTNAGKALREFERRRDAGETLPDLTLLDIRMPELDGYEFLEELEGLFDDDAKIPPIFMLTSSQHKRDLEAFERFRCAREYLNKPLHQDELQVLLARHFG